MQVGGGIHVRLLIKMLMRQLNEKRISLIDNAKSIEINGERVRGERAVGSDIFLGESLNLMESGVGILLVGV